MAVIIYNYMYMPSNEYDFILNQQPQKKAAGFAGNTKQTILFIIAGLVIFLLVIIVLVSVFGNKNTKETSLAPVVAAQNDLLTLTAMGIEDSRDIKTQNQSASINAVITSQNTTLSAELGKNAKKLTVPYQNDSFQQELEDAKNAGSFDKKYAAILANRMDLYRQSLVSAYSKAGTPKLKKQLEQYYSQVSVLLGEPTTPTQ